MFSEHNYYAFYLSDRTVLDNAECFATDRTEITALGKVMDYVLFCLSDQLLMYQDWSVKNIAVFIITGVAFSIAGVAVLQKKDL